MSTAVKITLIIAGTLELVLRMIFLIVMTVSIIGILMMMEEEFADLLRPWCYKYLREAGLRRQPTGDALLSRRQLRQLEFQRRLTALQAEHNTVLRQTRELEGFIFTDKV